MARRKAGDVQARGGKCGRPSTGFPRRTRDKQSEPFDTLRAGEGVVSAGGGGRQGLASILLRQAIVCRAGWF